MTVQSVLSNLRVPDKSAISVRIEVSSEVNISAFAARQLANQYLLHRIGDQVGALEPELVVGERLFWRLPVQYAPSLLGPLGIVGHLLVDAQSGEVVIDDERNINSLIDSAEVLYERAALSAGA